MSIPLKDSLLVPYCSNWQTRITAAPGDFGLVAGQATQFTSLFNPYNAAVDALNVAREAGTRAKSQTEARNAAKASLLAFARELYSTIQANTNVTNENKTLLGIHIRDNIPTPAPVPPYAPVTSIANVFGNTVSLRLRDTDVNRRGKPSFAKGAAVYYWVGETPGPTTPWQAFGNTGRTDLNIAFPPSLPQGTKVWIIASWYNSRGQFGPSCAPIGTLLLGQASGTQSSYMSIAA